MPEPERKKVFVSYSHEDEKWLERILAWLKPLEEEGLLDIWDDSKIKAGTLWAEEIDKYLKQAKAAVLLVTQDFLSSEFIKNNELPVLLDKAKTEGMQVLWIAVKPSTYRATPIRHYQAVNNPKKPLSGMGGAKLDEALLAIYESVRDAVT